MTTATDELAHRATERFLSAAWTARAVLRSSGSSSSDSADPLEDLEGVALRRPVLQADHGEPAHGGVRVARRELVQEGAERVDVSRVVPREALERDERRAARRRALVLEAPPQELDLLAEPELRDRAVGLGADAVVGVAGARLDLLVPLRPELREPPLVSRLGEGVRFGSRLRQGHESDDRARGAGPT